MCRCQLGRNQEGVRDDLPGTNNHRLRGLGPGEESEWGEGAATADVDTAEKVSKKQMTAQGLKS